MDPADILASMMMEEEEEEQKQSPSKPFRTDPQRPSHDAHRQHHPSYTRPSRPQSMTSMRPPLRSRDSGRSDRSIRSGHSGHRQATDAALADDIMNSMIMDMDPINKRPPSRSSRSKRTAAPPDSTNPEDVIQRIVQHSKSPESASKTSTYSTDDILKDLMSESDEIVMPMVDPMDIINRIVNKPPSPKKANSMPKPVVPQPTAPNDPDVFSRAVANGVHHDNRSDPSPQRPP